MGYAQDKYTSEYFLHRTSQGQITPFGVNGLTEFLSGDLRFHDRDILERIHFQGKTVLDIGFGRGESLRYAHGQGAKTLIGVDFSQAAYEIATNMLALEGIPAKLHCADALEWIKNQSPQTIGSNRIDIVLLLDVIEHLPRTEVAQLLDALGSWLSPTAILAVNTPIFGADNDVLTEGKNPQAADDSDDYPETADMHINRYTKNSLATFMASHGFTPISGHLFAYQFRSWSWLRKTRWEWRRACANGYPLNLSGWQNPEHFEYAYSRLQKRRREALQPLSLKIARKLYWAIRYYVGQIGAPPELPKTPRWVQIQSGVLRGRWLFVPIHSGWFWEDMILGIYDAWIYRFLATQSLPTETVIWDVGAHVGYHTLGFAQFVGDSGTVVAFEPNIHNLKRLRKHVRKHADLSRRIKIYGLALGDRVGKVTFAQTDLVENTTSSGSHVVGIQAPEPPEVYQQFQEVTVDQTTVDDLVMNQQVPPPRMIKIDVEGAESQVLLGAEKTLARYHPILLIEIHTVVQMFKISELMRKWGYQLEILDAPSDSTSRCFVVATEQPIPSAGFVPNRQS